MIIAPRYTITRTKNCMCTVTDTTTGFAVTFLEGLFNDTQDVTTPDNLNEEQIKAAPTIMRELGDWVAQNCPDLAQCNPGARFRAICMLDVERYWLALADALNGLIIDAPADECNNVLFDEIDDYIRLHNGIGLNESEATNMLGSISLLSDDETKDVLQIVRAYWHHFADTVNAADWASELLWWPALCPQDLREADIPTL